MSQCLINDSSLKFSRATYGVLLLLAFSIRNEWLVLAVGLLIIFGAFSFKLNIPYQFHALIIKKFLKNKNLLTPRDLNELNFVAAVTGVLILVGFLFIYFDKFIDYVWIYILIVTMMIFLACFVGFCVATLTYVFFKKIFAK